MADISIKRNHQLEREKMEATIEKLAQKLTDRLGGTWCWEGDTAVCELSGARATVEYDASTVSIDVTLPAMMRPLRSRIERKIDEYYERYFGTAES